MRICDFRFAISDCFGSGRPVPNRQLKIEDRKLNLVVIGASLGGARTLETLLGGLSADFPLPVAIVLHRGRFADESLAAEAGGQGVIGIILTGANNDGARGLAAIKARGGLAVVQDPATAESRAMPDAALATVQADQVLPVNQMAAWLVEVCHATAKRELSTTSGNAAMPEA